MDMVTITKVTKKEYDCNAYRCESKAKLLFKVSFEFNPRQGTSIIVCPDHLLELRKATEVIIPIFHAKKLPKILPAGPSRLPVGWQKVIEDNAAKRRKA